MANGAIPGETGGAAADRMRSIRARRWGQLRSAAAGAPDTVSRMLLTINSRSANSDAGADRRRERALRVVFHVFAALIIALSLAATLAILNMR